MNALPQAAGHFWAQWRICSPGTADEAEFEPSFTWEVVQVFENCLDETDAEHLMVFVPGVAKAQPLDGFFWGAQVPEHWP